MSETHALLSPSGSHGWMECVGKPAMEYGEPNESSSYADEGTAAHQVAAWCMTEDRDAAAYIGRRVDLKTRTIEVTADMAEHVQKYVNFVREIAKGHELLVEQKVPLSHITGEENAEGTSDAVVITADGEELIVIDLKFGMGVRVDAYYIETIGRPVNGQTIVGHIEHGNPQLLMYASGALEKFEPLGNFKRIRIIVHQPRIDHISEWDCTVEELRKFEAKAKEAATLAMIAFRNRDNWLGKKEVAAFLTPGDEQCRWCRAKAKCPALATQVARVISGGVVDDFEDLTNVPLKELVEMDAIEPRASFVTNEMIASFLPALDLIEDWCNAVRARAEVELLAGRAVPGYKIVAGKKGARAWIDADEVEKKLKAMRLKQDQIYDFKLISPTTAEKLLADQPKRWAALADLIKQSEGKPHVAPVSDKRPALEIKPASDDFSVVDDGAEFV